jgi:hypothetical protein
VSNAPGAVGVLGHEAVTATCAAVRTGQVNGTEFVTDTPQMLRPVAVEMLVLEQLVGAK